MKQQPTPLQDIAPDLARLLTRDDLARARFSVGQIRCETLMIPMRDGIRLATDIYFPPDLPAPVIARRAPYGRANDRMVGAFMSFARRGYVVVSQDVRGTGDSEPDHWDYYMHESEDGYDFVDWVSQQQWFDGFLGSCGGSYDGQTQWCMARHPRMSTIVPEVSALGVASNTAHHHMTLNAYARSVGKGEGKVPVPYTELERLMLDETLSTGFFNEPLHRPLSPSLLARYRVPSGLSPSEARQRLWERYSELPAPDRATLIKQALGTHGVGVLEAEAAHSIFGHRISHDALTLPHPDPSALCREFCAPPLMITGWYDWCLNDAFATWRLLRHEAAESVASRARLIVTPATHNTLGYHEGITDHPELQHNHRVANHVGLLLRWYEAVRAGATDSWPRIIYYLMGANDWRVTDDWPPPEAERMACYFGSERTLTWQPPERASKPDQFTYDPESPTPTVGGSIVSSVYPPGSVDVSGVQERQDVLTYTTPPLEQDLDIVGPLRLILYASSSAVDTDFAARLSDVFPDGRAIQLQAGMLRARYRNLESDPELLEPGRIYRFEIDMWATANRFKAGHCLRVDISSADFPRFDRNSNRGGEPGAPVPAHQTVYHDPAHASHLLVFKT